MRHVRPACRLPHAAGAVGLQRPTTHRATSRPSASRIRRRCCSCDAAAAQGAVGKVATPALVEKARHDAGAETARVLKPRQVVTMEYLAERLNLYVDANNVVTRVTCG